MKKTSVKTISAFLGILLILLSFPLFSSCHQDGIPNSYIQGGGSANSEVVIVLDGERYVLCEELAKSGWTVINYDILERVGKVYFNDFLGMLGDSTYIYRITCFDQEIPILYESREYDAFFFLESRYDECLAYMKNIQWSETLYYPVVVNTYHKVLSQELSKHLLSDHDSSLQRAEFEKESNSMRSHAQFKQYDSTRSFARDAGKILIRAQGDCYYFPNGFSYSSTEEFYPEGELYDQRTETIYKQYQIDPQYWAELREKFT